MASVPADSPVTVKRIPNPDEPVPHVAKPTLALFLGGLGLFAASTTLALTDVFPWPVSIVLNTIAAYLLCTVSHDAAHHSASSNATLNKWLGRLSTPLFAPHAPFPTWRYIHMQHHRFTNHDDGNDPDGYTMRGPKWQMPLRWLTIDYYYLVFYLPRLKTRPKAEQRELIVHYAITTPILIAIVATGNIVPLLLLFFLPLRLSILWLAYAFDYLPHHGLHHKPTEDRLKTTRNRVGKERLMAPLFLYQNYHLVHHLHPLVPFYKYIAVWRRNEESYLAGDPALSTLGGREITPDEYRRLRELAEH